LHPGLVDAAVYAIELAGQNGFEVIVTSTARTWAEQVALYDHWVKCQQAGRAYQPPDCLYPANQPGDTAHHVWKTGEGRSGALAFDSVPADRGVELPKDDYRWDWWKQIREYVGFRVPENDFVHAELPNWREYTVSIER
jgi:hypothetical protein